MYKQIKFETLITPNERAEETADFAIRFDKQCFNNMIECKQK